MDKIWQRKFIILGGVVMLILVVTFEFCMYFFSGQSPYRITDGNVEQLQLSQQQQEAGFMAVLRAEQGKVRLHEGTVLEFQGEIGLYKTLRKIHLFQGKAHFQVKPKETSFIVLSRVGKIEVLGTDFEAALQQLPAPPNAQPDDNGATLQVKVYDGQVAVLPQAKKRPQILQAGQDIQFLLGEVKREGQIQALGFGVLPQPASGPAKAMQKRGAEMSMRRGLQEFITGMQFTVTTSPGTSPTLQAEFSTEGTQKFSNLETKYQPLNDQVLLCMGTVTAERVLPVERRNCIAKSAQGLADIAQHPNIPMAILAARNNAILMIIQEAALELYGSELPAQLKGRFFPESFVVSQKGNQMVAEVRGEVLLE